MPPKMFKNVQFASLVVCATFSSMVFYALSVLWPFIIGKVFNNGSHTIAWSVSLLAFGATLGIFMTAVPSLRGKHFRKQCMVASGVALALMAPLCTIWFDGRQGPIVLVGIIASFGKSCGDFQALPEGFILIHRSQLLVTLLQLPSLVSPLCGNRKISASHQESSAQCVAWAVPSQGHW